MPQEQKRIALLLTDLCARLPFGVNVLDDMGRTYKLQLGNAYLIDLFYGNGDYVEAPIRPYLRPMNTMTEEEVQEIRDRLNNLSIGRTITEKNFEKCCDFLWFTKMSSFECVSEKMMEVVIGYLDENMFDHRGLIPKGLALEATEGIYKI